MAWRKKMLQTLVVTAAVTAFCVSSLQAGIITFDLRDASIEDIDEVVSFALTDTSSGLTATLTANIGELNQTNTGFGINAPEGGDDTDTIDDIKGTESVTITFNEPVTFDQLVLSLFSSGEAASLSIAGGFPVLSDRHRLGPPTYLTSRPTTPFPSGKQSFCPMRAATASALTTSR